MQMIQTVVARLASQSMTIKGWSVTVTSAILGFGATAARPLVALIAVYVIVAFAVLDAYYLALERAYRELYRQAGTGEVELWALAVARPTPRGVLTAFRSPVIVVLYGASLLVAASVIAFLALR